MKILSSRERLAFAAIIEAAEYDAANNDQRMSAQGFAKKANIPSRYMEVTFQELTRAGILLSARGPSGGYVLGRSTKKITVGMVLDALLRFRNDHRYEYSLDSLSVDNAANIALDKLTQNFIKNFRKITVADLIKYEPMVVAA